MASPELSRGPDAALLRSIDIALLGVAASFSPLRVMAAHMAALFIRNGFWP